jgi:hypothetical protein
MPQKRDVDDPDNPELEENDLDREQPIGRSDEETAGRADKEDDEALEDEESEEDPEEDDDEVV